jgi:DNA-binding NarL/FixJ family response regulator
MTDPAATGPIPLRVLVVDPDDRIRESITRLLPIGGRCAVVGSAGTPDEAVDLAATLSPDVVVIDSRLADDGSTEGCIGRLRSIAPGIRVLVLNWTETLETDSSLHGADAYIRKTFRAHELIDAVVSAARIPAA